MYYLTFGKLADSLLFILGEMTAGTPKRLAWAKRDAYWLIRLPSLPPS